MSSFQLAILQEFTNLLVVCQNGDRSEMIWKVPEIIISLSEFFSLSAGDLIFTGTPAGVGSVRQGDMLSGEIEGVGSFDVSVT